jgi:hypothetical protein
VSQRFGRLAAIVAGLMVMGAPAQAQEPDTTLARLQAQLDAITRELEELQLGRDVVVEADTSVLGFGPAASKVYKVRQGVSLGGYGEVLYENFASETQSDVPSGLTDQIDALRAIVYVGYKFSDKILFNSEVEFEHGSTEEGGSVSVEFAYLEYQATASLALRAGLLLLPVGFINELHEPTTFYSANRPEIERLILPTTWRENGLGVVGGGEQWSYRAYLVNGFDASGFTSNGLRNGRQKGGEASAEDVALVGRLDYVGLENALLGLSAYWGNSGQNLDGVGNVRTQMVDLHGEYRFRGLRARALGVLARLGDTSELNDALGLTGDDAIGRELSGYYLELGYDVLAEGESDQSLIPFVRYEQYDTQDEVAFGFSEDPARDQSNWTFGLAYQPTSQVIFKVDYVDADNEANSGQDLFRLSMGYVF